METVIKTPIPPLVVDAHGLPAQTNGDCADQLNRVGMICVTSLYNPGVAVGCNLPLMQAALASGLQPTAGTYSRFTGATPLDVTCDQLIPTIAYWVLTGVDNQIEAMFNTMLKRWGFAQNVQEDGDATVSTTPDLMLFRAMPLFCRWSWWFYPFALFWDAYLVIMAISLVISATGEPDTVDDNNSLTTFFTCRVRMPTPWSMLAAWFYRTYRPTNYGVTTLGETNNVQGAMSWYHRTATGGNPIIAEFWRPIITMYFGA